MPADATQVQILAGNNLWRHFGSLGRSNTLVYVSKWRAFINAHKDEIKAEKRRKADDPEISALFPPIT